MEGEEGTGVLRLRERGSEGGRKERKGRRRKGKREVGVRKGREDVRLPESKCRRRVERERIDGIGDRGRILRGKQGGRQERVHR